MNFKIKVIMIVFFGMFLTICKGQTINNFTNEEETLIIGTWVAEGSDISEKWVFTQNNLLFEYTNNEIDERYNWLITSSINSGVKSVYLKLTNVNDSTDIYKYEISVVNNEILTLIYQREENNGISNPMTYIKQ